MIIEAVMAIDMLIYRTLPLLLQVWLPHKQHYRCVDGFCSYVAKDELVESGSVISKGFVPLYPAQTAVNFDIYGCLHKKAR